MNEDKMELEEAMQILKKEIEPKGNRIAMELDIQAIEIVLKELENRISREKVEDKKQWLIENILQNDYAYDRDKDIAEYQVNVLDEILEDR